MSTIPTTARNAFRPRARERGGLARGRGGLAPGRAEVAANLVLLGLFLVAARWQITLYLGSMFEDDAYFYFRIARTILAGGGISFDGIDPTNGFHPGWLGALTALLLPLASVLDFDSAVVVASAVPVLFFALTLRPLWFLMVVAALPFLGFGMEGVAAAVLALLMARGIDRGSFGPTALAAAALVLTRVDLLVLVAAAAGWLGWERRRLALGPALGGAAGLLLLVGFNLWLTGHPFSISSAIKAGAAGGGGLDMLIWNVSSSGNLVRLALYALPLALLAWRGSGRAGFAGHPAFLGGVLAFLAIHAVLSALRDWYFAVPVLTALWAAGRSGPLPLAALIPGAALPVAAAAFFQLASLDEAVASRAAHRALDRAMPEDAPLFVYDASGYAGYMLWPRPVINGDGLVNSFDYLALFRDPAGFFDYLARTGTRHYLSELREPRCVTPWFCCRPEDIVEIERFPPTRWYADKRAWRFRDGTACRLDP